jgi:hypothetical protein
MAPSSARFRFVAKNRTNGRATGEREWSERSCELTADNGRSDAPAHSHAAIGIVDAHPGLGREDLDAAPIAALQRECAGIEIVALCAGIRGGPLNAALDRGRVEIGAFSRAGRLVGGTGIGCGRSFLANWTVVVGFPATMKILDTGGDPRLPHGAGARSRSEGDRWERRGAGSRWHLLERLRTC